MKTLLSRWLPAVTLATWSGVLFYYHFAQRMDSLLTGEFRVYALIAACVLAVMAVMFVVFRGDTACCSAAECGHGLSRSSAGKWLTFLVLIVPITVAAHYTKPGGFSGNFVRNQGTAQDTSQLNAGIKSKLDEKFTAPGKINRTPDPLPLPMPDGEKPAKVESVSNQPTDWLVRTPEGYIMAEVLDLIYAAQDQVLRKDFEGKKVQLIGQFLPDRDNSKRFKAVRMFMVCCAADTQPVATLVELDKLPELPEMTWVKIVGIPTFPVEKGRRIAVLKAEKVEKTEPPPEGTF